MNEELILSLLRIDQILTLTYYGITCQIYQRIKIIYNLIYLSNVLFSTTSYAEVLLLNGFLFDLVFKR